jgi:hypothetical protein
MFAGVRPADVGMQLGVAIAVGSIIGLTVPPLGIKLLVGEPTIKPLRLARMLLTAAILPCFLTLFAWLPWHFYALLGAQLVALLGTGSLMPGVLQQLSPPALRSRLISVLGMCGAVASGLSPMLVGALSGSFDAKRGLITAIVIVSLPAWSIAALLMSLSRRHVAATIALLKPMAPDAS